MAKKNSIDSILFTFLLERIGLPIAYHTLEKDFPVYALHNYNKVCSAQTLGRVFRSLVEKAPILFNGNKALHLIETTDSSHKRVKYWVATIKAIDYDLFGQPIPEKAKL